MNITNPPKYNELWVKANSGLRFKGGYTDKQMVLEAIKYSDAEHTQICLQGAISLVNDEDVMEAVVLKRPDLISYSPLVENRKFIIKMLEKTGRFEIFLRVEWSNRFTINEEIIIAALKYCPYLEVCEYIFDFLYPYSDSYLERVFNCMHLRNRIKEWQDGILNNKEFFIQLAECGVLISKYAGKRILHDMELQQYMIMTRDAVSPCCVKKRKIRDIPVYNVLFLFI